MKKLNELYPGYPDILINDIKINSKDCKYGDLFVCINGVNSNRHDYINEAINNGCSAIVASKKIKAPVPIIYVKDTNKELPILCRKFYDEPDEKLELIGVTGTNGKTTVASIIKDLIGDNICGYQGTNGIICSKFNEKIINTTPDADRLYKYMNRFVDAGCKYLSIETSSEAFYRNRLDGLKFKIGILTNITEDHLNVHKTLKNYVDCKKKLFKQVKKNGYSILNKDSNYYDEFRKIANGKVLTYGKNNADIEIIKIEEYIDKTDITIKYRNKIYSFSSSLLGEFNVYNLCAAILALIALNYKIEDIISKICDIKTPSGRCEFLKYDQTYNIILDYAHTPDAFKNIYSLLNKIKKNRIITVTGSAGGREHEKRPLMGKIVLENSDYTIFTMDDPRYEDVNSIIDDLISISDNKNYKRIIDRSDAIKYALDIALEDDIVLIAGKACDNYMAIGDKYIDYCDIEVINNYFNNKKM